jgi:soluble lytic murein transglycosylase-like protein
MIQAVLFTLSMALKSIANFIGKTRLQPAYLLPILLLISQQTAHADVWGYIDAKGVAHFAAEQVDERYELFFKGGESFDTVNGISSKNGKAAVESTTAATPDSAAKSATNSLKNSPANAKILAYFDVSTNYKAVRHHMRDAAKTYNVDFELLQAIIVAESGFDTLAVSPKGAIGLMQLMPETAKRFGVKADKNKTVEQKLHDPKTNINAGAKYLRSLINMFPGKLELAIASYNAGEGAVQKYGNVIPPYKETQNYVKTVVQTFLAIKPPVTLLQAKAAEKSLTTSSTSAANNAPTRVRMQMGGAVVGGAVGRGNMMTPLATADSATVLN